MILTAKQNTMMDRHNGTGSVASVLSDKERAELLSLFDRSQDRGFSRDERERMRELERRMRRAR